MAIATTTEARTALSRMLVHFREHGVAAEPLVFGDHRRPEAVVLPYDVYVQLEHEIDQLRLDSATSVMRRIEGVVADPGRAIKVERRRIR